MGSGVCPAGRGSGAGLGVRREEMSCSCWGADRQLRRVLPWHRSQAGGLCAWSGSQQGLKKGGQLDGLMGRFRYPEQPHWEATGRTWLENRAEAPCLLHAPLQGWGSNPKLGAGSLGSGGVNVLHGATLDVGNGPGSPKGGQSPWWWMRGISVHLCSLGGGADGHALAATLRALRLRKASPPWNPAASPTL